MTEEEQKRELMKDDAKIFLKDIVGGTATNKEGVKLHYALASFMKNNEKVIVSLQNSTPMSSDFLTASIGEIVDEFGIERFKNLVSFTHFTKFQARQLQRYFKISQIRN